MVFIAAEAGIISQARSEALLKREFILLLSIALSIAITLSGVMASEADRVGEIAQGKEALRALLPTEEEIAGWESSSPPRFFEPGNLWEYINGQAEFYLQYGFQLVVTSDYASREDSNSLIVDIYLMESPRHAFGIYAAERTPDDNFIDVGVQGYVAGNILNFWKGPYYVKLTSFQSSPTGEEVLIKLSRVIADKIPGNYSEPELFACFPDKNKVKMSERYIPKNFLGHGFLKNGYLVDYHHEGIRYQVFLVENSSPEEAEEAFSKYLNFLKTEGEIISHEKKSDYQKMRTKNRKKVVIFQYGSILGGVLNFGDSADEDKIIEKILTKLRGRNRSQSGGDNDKKGFNQQSFPLIVHLPHRAPVPAVSLYAAGGKR
ncbi:hypothetical protein CEE39_09950 [bacterium (candidate division B38) B3_B38]|nr:MAG: hypothetical protein CEE39_09950 [bacterium (candidate division B38) B3_B38]